MSIAYTLESVHIEDINIVQVLKHMAHQEETIDLLNSRDCQNLERIGDLEEQVNIYDARIEYLEQEKEYMEQRYKELHQRHYTFVDWTRNLFANKTIPVACKMVLWHLYTTIGAMRPEATGEEMRVSVEQTADALGYGDKAISNAIKKAEMWDVLTRRDEEVTTESGEPRTLAYITLSDAVNHPESIAMEKNHGGIRVKKCSNCGSTDVDRYTVQNCRCCGKNAWYAQLGTRKDAPWELAQKADNMPLYNSGMSVKNQDAFGDSEIEETATRIENVLAVVDSGMSVKNQDAFERNDSEPAAQISQESDQLETQHSKVTSTSSWIKPMVRTCHAKIALNEAGRPAHAMVQGHPEKIVSFKECGGTRWKRSDGEVRCTECDTPVSID